MEVLARDLKALGLYAARSLSYEGVQYELVEHQLTDEQIAIYDAYAGAFRIIHNHLDAAMKAAGITGASGTLNAQAKAAARSAFESSKQRFFSHLITSMKTPTLIRSIDQDLEDGHAAIIQIVSTGEALMERRLADIPTEDWNDVQVDVTPREYVLDYLMHSFPVQLFEEYSDDEGNIASRPVFRDGNPVLCREAVERRDALMEHLASLPPVPAALDQILHRFGADKVAEVTGRSRRILRKLGRDGIDRLAVENRAGSANLSEAQAFQNDDKRILVFSDAGGTGRSYHADLGVRNQRLRVHYMLEAGWRADTAIQGLGRSNRTNQAQPPLFRPVATNVKGEKRFLSTIARRLDTLGAITKGQRQTGGQGLFRADDNLESHYARDALRQFYMLLFSGKVAACSLTEFQDATGLALTDEGGLRDELPPITTFLNRILALPIALQNAIFEVFEQLLEARIEGAIAARNLRQGPGDDHGGIADDRFPPHDLHPQDRRRDADIHHPAQGAQPPPGACRRPRHARRAPDAQHPFGTLRRPGPRAEPDARRRRDRKPRAPAASDGSARFARAHARADGVGRHRRRHPDRRVAATRSPPSPNSRSRRCTSPPAFSCRSGAACPMTIAASTVWRRMKASASSAA